MTCQNQQLCKQFNNIGVNHYKVIEIEVLYWYQLILGPPGLVIHLSVWSELHVFIQTEVAQSFSNYLLA